CHMGAPGRGDPAGARAAAADRGRLMSRQRHFLSALAALMLAIILASPVLQRSALAQETPAEGTDREERAVLMADTLYVTPSRQLVAEGHVEALHGDVR